MNLCLSEIGRFILVSFHIFFPWKFRDWFVVVFHSVVSFSSSIVHVSKSQRRGFHELCASLVLGKFNFHLIPWQIRRVQHRESSITSNCKSDNDKRCFNFNGFV